MSVDIIFERIKKFISNDENDLIVIKGEWGIGKTFFWKELVSIAASDSKLGKENYAYVSLFGVNDLSDLKNAIITSFEKSRELNQENDLGGMLKRAGSIFKNLEDIPKIGDWSNIATYAAFQFLKNGLICFDDLERKGNDLDFKELFGLATALKETKNCKIVFILNDEFLERNKEEFKIHGEKLIDFEVKFDRSPADAFDCVFTSDHDFYQVLKDHCIKLEIRNIRILQRIKRYVEPLLEALKDSEDETSFEVLHSLVLFCWSSYAKGDKVPPLKFIEKYNDNIFSILKDEDLNDDEKIWKESLNNYQFIYLSELDQEVLQYVTKGYFQEDNLVFLIKNKNFHIKKKIARKNYEKAWDIYNNSFEDNADEFITALIKSFKENLEFLTPKQLNSVLSVLRDLDENKKADDLIDLYFTKHSKLQRFGLSHTPYQGHISDQKLKEKLLENENKNKESINLEKTIKKLTNSSSYNPEDIACLSNSSVDDFYDFFKSQNSENLIPYVKRCLEFGNYANPGPEYEGIYKKSVDALKKIAKQSEINRTRVKSLYNIELEDS